MSQEPSASQVSQPAVNSEGIVDRPSTTRTVTLRREYPDAPLIGVAAVVFDDDGRILLVQRGRPPMAGRWGLPGGLLDLGEKLADGARREVYEECAVDIKVYEVVGTYEPIQWDEQGQIQYHYVVIDFWARYLGGDLRAQDDAAAAVWVRWAELDHYQLASETREVIENARQSWHEHQG